MKFKLSLILLALSLFIISCDDDSNDDNIQQSPIENLNLISQIDDGGHSVKIYSENTSFREGINTLYFEVEMAGEMVETSWATITPMMKMMMGEMAGMEHSAPHFEETFVEGYIKKDIVFVMPSVNGEWRLEMNVDMGNHTHEFVIPIEVEAYEHFRRFNIDGTGYFMSVLGLDNPQVGNNNLMVGLYKRESMMIWPVADDFSFEMTPWMPSMGHGSTGNINPEFSSDDNHYKASVNFNMTGDWDVEFKLMDNQGVNQTSVTFSLVF